MPPLPPEKTTQLMRFIAEKTNNVISPMNVTELSRQYKEETGSSVAVKTLASRIETYRLKIHGMAEFDMKTKVKMMFALSAPIDAAFLIEMQKVAEVGVDHKRRIIRYKQKDGGLELCVKHWRLSMDQAEQRDRDIIQLLAEKSKTTDKPIDDKVLLREFKEKTACPDTNKALERRYQRVKNTIFELPGVDKNTKIKMMFISNAQLPNDVLEELRENADVGVDEKKRITKYIANNGSLDLKANRQNAYELKRIDLIRFLIERTKNATFPLSIKQLAKDYMTEFRSLESHPSVNQRISSFRQRIYKMNQFDMSTKIKIMFALSASIGAEFLKELQKCAIVELDEKQRIKKYKANDGSLELEGDHSHSAKIKAGWAERKKRRVVKDSSESEDDGDEENGSGYAKMSRGTKRARISYSSSEISEEEPPEEDDDEESEKIEDDIAMDSETNNIDNGGGYFDQMSYNFYNEREHAKDMDHIPLERKPENLIEVKTEVPEEPSGGENSLIEPKLEESLIEVKMETPEEPSTSSIEYHYEDNLDNFLTEPKPEVDL